MKIRSLGNILEKYVIIIIIVEIYFWNVMFLGFFDIKLFNGFFINK